MFVVADRPGDVHSPLILWIRLEWNEWLEFWPFADRRLRLFDIDVVVGGGRAVQNSVQFYCSVMTLQYYGTPESRTTVSSSVTVHFQ